ncbi:MAG: nuclear transport factor 2 family protein [Actinobacteria bacterium]|nr:nuclear transport factor 2 family protein [Actinomycetota bacterium]
MPSFPREELEEMIRRFRATNDEAGRSGSWAALADFYTEDALYTWNNGPRHEFVARGRDQIRDWVLGTEMEGLEGWEYDYVRTLIDDEQGEVVAFWRQQSPAAADGSRYEIAGTGGSWFHYAGDFQWDWQRDFFDHMNAGTVFLQMAKDERLSVGMHRRMEQGAGMPGWVRLEEFDWHATIPG